MATRKCRIALYSHDTQGLGHFRRNLLIAQAIADSSFPATILMIAGAREAGAFPMPSDVDCLALPAFYKGVDGAYRSRQLDLTLQELVDLRGKAIAAALESFCPDVLIVDNKPRGAVKELDRALKRLRARGRTRCVLGLRDVLDDPVTIATEWSRAGNENAIRRYYDVVWVYGDPTVYDPVKEYCFDAEVAAKVCYTGYLDRSVSLPVADEEDAEWFAPANATEERLILCLLGGGQDGASLAEAFSQAEFPNGVTGVILTGPFLPPQARERLRRQAAQRPHLKVIGFVTDPYLLLSRADRVIAMGGYNTTCEVLCFGKRALIVPRIGPRREQLIRAKRLRDLGLLDMLDAAELTPRALSEWLARDLPPLPATRNHIDLNGLARLPQLLQSVLTAGPSRMEATAGPSATMPRQILQPVENSR